MRRTVAPPLGEVVCRARRTEHREVEDERDDLGATVERSGDDVAAQKGDQDQSVRAGHGQQRGRTCTS